MIVIGDEGGEGGGIMRFRGGEGVLSGEPCSISKETMEEEGDNKGNVLKVLSN
jgi:hypothetical protein